MAMKRSRPSTRAVVTNSGVPGEGLSRFPAPGDYPCGLTWDGHLLWHSDQKAGCIYAIDATNGSVAHAIGCPDVRADLTFDGTRLCQGGGRPKRLGLVEPSTGSVVGHTEILPASGRVTGVELGPEGLWMCL